MSQESENVSPQETDLLGGIPEKKTGDVLRKRFVVSPFSIFEVDEGNWQNRKRAWMTLGIRSEKGRKPNMLGMSRTILQPNKEKRRISAEQNKDDEGGTSVFDPALCEFIYKSFPKAKGQVIDPFAGGSVRGIVAGCLGLKYWGCELRNEQVEENLRQAEEISKNFPKKLREMPEWVVGDSRIELAKAPKADLIFSCPPYGNLEPYKAGPRDLSGMSRPEFLNAYKDIIAKAVAKLRNDSFACFVVADYRDKKTGLLQSLVGPTVEFFEKAGAMFYNHAILATPKGSAAIRATGMWTPARKLVPVHQHVLIFCKGDPRKATEKNTGLTVVEEVAK